MRKVTKKERIAAGNLYCSFCRPDKVDAIWRKTGICDHVAGFACEEHKDMIEEVLYNEDYSEADYQTWLSV